MSRETVAWVTTQPAEPSASSSSCCVPSRRRSTRLAMSRCRSGLARCRSVCIKRAFRMQTPTAITLCGVQETEFRPSENGGGVREAAKEVVESGATVAQLAADDLKRQIGALALGVGFGAGALLVAVFTVGLGLATIAVALATFLALWLAMLIVTGATFAATVMLALLARRQFKKGSPALPKHFLRA